MPILAFLTALLASLGLAVEPGATSVAASVTFPAAEAPPAGPFRGTLAAYDSATRVPISGEVKPGASGAVLSVTLPYASVPEDWATRFRLEGLQYRLRSEAGREWTGSVPWSEIGLSGDEALARQYVQLKDLEVTEVSLFGSQARATLRVKNPFAFPLKVAETRYVLFADGAELGRGETKGRTLHAAKDTELQLPLELDHARLLSAAGKVMGSGGRADVRLEGRLLLRLSGGDVAVPFALTGKLGV
ncbi:MAG TPA: LEA type 2 family protein [Thermoanaerobaculia bacterium]